MEALGAVEARLAAAERQIDAHHTAIGHRRAADARQDTEIAVTHKELEGMRDDIKEIREKELPEIKEQLKWVARGIWSAAISFFVAFVALVGQFIH